jgi:hypothetical protein
MAGRSPMIGVGNAILRGKNSAPRRGIKAKFALARCLAFSVEAGASRRRSQLTDAHCVDAVAMKLRGQVALSFAGSGKINHDNQTGFNYG